VGALLGPLIPNAFARDYRSVRWLFVPYLIRGVGDILLAVFTPLPVALLLMFVYGLNTSAGGVVYRSMLQSEVPDAVRGRVFTLLDSTWNALRLLSLAVGGLLIDVIGVRPVYWLGGGLLLFSGALGLVLLGGYRARGPVESRTPAN